jgi:hypothetical protein
MKSRYSILFGAGFVIGLLYLVNIIISDSSVTTTLLIPILIAGGYISTYTSNIGKSRVALLSGILVSVILIVYQLFINKTIISNSLDLISFIVIPGFVMVIGGFMAKLTRNMMDSLLNNLFKRNIRLKFNE